MGYDLHITRADSWAENEGQQISAEEWHALVELDPELRFDPDSGPHFAVWNGGADDREEWLDWCDGNVTTKNPDKALLAKMLQIAHRLNARVQGDDGELYTGPESFVDVERGGRQLGGPRISFVMSSLALILALVLLTLDSHLRVGRGPHSPRPTSWAVLMGLCLVVGGISWMASTIFALCSLVVRQPGKRLGGLTLLLNAISAWIITLGK